MWERRAGFREAALDPGRGACGQFAIGDAGLVGVGGAAGLVQARLEPAARGGRERVAGSPTGGRVDHRRDGAAEAEVRGGFDRRRCVDAHQSGRPGAGGHNGHASSHAARAHAVVVLREVLDPASLTHVQTGRESLDGCVCDDDAAVRLIEPAVAGIGTDPEPVLDLTCVEHVERHLARGKRVAVRRPVAEVERPVQLEQRHAALGLELTPEREALLREPHPALIRIRKADDP